MKTIAALLFVMLAGQAQAVTQSKGEGKAAFVSCELTGGCAPAGGNQNKGFVAPFDAADLYSYSEQDNIKREISEAKQYMNVKRQEEHIQKQQVREQQARQQQALMAAQSHQQIKPTSNDLTIQMGDKKVLIPNIIEQGEE